MPPDPYSDIMISRRVHFLSTTTPSPIQTAGHGTVEEMTDVTCVLQKLLIVSSSLLLFSICLIVLLVIVNSLGRLSYVRLTSSIVTLRVAVTGSLKSSKPSCFFSSFLHLLPPLADWKECMGQNSKEEWIFQQLLRFTSVKILYIPHHYWPPGYFVESEFHNTKRVYGRLLCCHVTRTSDKSDSRRRSWPSLRKGVVWMLTRLKKQGRWWWWRWRWRLCMMVTVVFPATVACNNCQYHTTVYIYKSGHSRRNDKCIGALSYRWFSSLKLPELII